MGIDELKLSELKEESELNDLREELAVLRNDFSFFKKDFSLREQKLLDLEKRLKYLEEKHSLNQVSYFKAGEQLSLDNILNSNIKTNLNTNLISDNEKNDLKSNITLKSENVNSQVSKGFEEKIFNNVLNKLGVMFVTIAFLVLYSSVYMNLQSPIFRLGSLIFLGFAFILIGELFNKKSNSAKHNLVISDIFLSIGLGIHLISLFVMTTLISSELIYLFYYVIMLALGYFLSLRYSRTSVVILNVISLGITTIYFILKYLDLNNLSYIFAYIYVIYTIITISKIRLPKYNFEIFVLISMFYMSIPLLFSDIDLKFIYNMFGFILLLILNFKNIDLDVANYNKSIFYSIVFLFITGIYYDMYLISVDKSILYIEIDFLYSFMLSLLFYAFYNITSKYQEININDNKVMEFLSICIIYIALLVIYNLNINLANSYKFILFGFVSVIIIECISYFKVNNLNFIKSLFIYVLLSPIILTIYNMYNFPSDFIKIISVIYLAAIFVYLYIKMLYIKLQLTKIQEKLSELFFIRTSLVLKNIETNKNEKYNFGNLSKLYKSNMFIYFIYLIMLCITVLELLEFKLDIEVSYFILFMMYSILSYSYVLILGYKNNKEVVSKLPLLKYTMRIRNTLLYFNIPLFLVYYLFITFTEYTLNPYLLISYLVIINVLELVYYNLGISKRSFNNEILMLGVFNFVYLLLYFLVLSISTVYLNMYIGLFTIVFLMLGFKYDLKSVRLTSLFLILILAVKMLLIDSFNLPMIFKTLSYGLFGLTLIALVYVYNKFIIKKGDKNNG